MNLIQKLLNWRQPKVEANSNFSPYLSASWWGLDGNNTGSFVGPDTALKISTVYACVGLLAETIASLPLVMYQYTDNETGRQKAKNHPLYSVLHDQPNENQTAFEFIQMLQTHALLRGSGYAKIVAGPRGFADSLIPIHPDNVVKEKLTNGKIRYRITEDNGQIRNYSNEDIFEVGGLTLDGWNTVSVVNNARESLGLTLSAERYGNRFFRNDSRPGGVLTTDSTLKKDAATRIKGEWEALHSGENQHRVAVLEQGLKWQQVGISPEEAQFLGTREFQAEDVCRWFRVPPHMVGLTSKATSWGSGIEQMAIGFLTYTLRPWLTRWTQAIRRDLILAPNVYFADFVVEHLLKGDITSRYNAYAVGRQWGWLSVNEIRGYENLNPVPGGDMFLSPMNMSPANKPNNNTEQQKAEHYRLLAEESAARLVRKEIAALSKLTTPESRQEFYKNHAKLVSQAMQMPIEWAISYCQQGLNELEQGCTMEDWPERRVNDLAYLAMGTKRIELDDSPIPGWR